MLLFSAYYTPGDYFISVDYLKARVSVSPVPPFFAHSDLEPLH